MVVVLQNWLAESPIVRKKEKGAGAFTVGFRQCIEINRGGPIVYGTNAVMQKPRPLPEYDYARVVGGDLLLLASVESVAIWSSLRNADTVSKESVLRISRATLPGVC